MIVNDKVFSRQVRMCTFFLDLVIADHWKIQHQTSSCQSTDTSNTNTGDRESVDRARTRDGREEKNVPRYGKEERKAPGDATANASDRYISRGSRPGTRLCRP